MSLPRCRSRFEPIMNRPAKLLFVFAVLLHCGGYAADNTPPTNGLVAEWEFEGRDDRVIAEKNHLYDGFLHSAVWREGKVGNALKIYGIVGGKNSNHVSVPNCNFHLGSEFSIAAWIKEAPGSTFRVFLAKGQKADDGHYELNVTPDNKFQFYAPNLGAFTSTKVVADNAWHHVAVTFSGGQATIHVDGVAEPARSASGAMAVNGTDTLFLGSLLDGTAGFTGALDGVRIYQRAVTPAEISGMIASEDYVGANLMAWWKLDETAGSVASDSSGNGCHGTISGTTRINGKSKGALLFDTSDSHGISYGEIPDFRESPGPAFTFAVWIKSADYHMMYQKKTILAKEPAGTGSYSLYTDADGYFHFAADELGDFKSDTRVLADAEWHHLAVTCDGRHLNLFVDGRMDKSADVSGRIGSSNGRLSFGGKTPGDYFWGLIDQVRIYNRELTGDEIQSLLCEKAPPAAPQEDTGTVVARVDCGTATDGIDGFSADRAFANGRWGYVDKGTSESRIFEHDTYSIYGGYYMLKSRRESAEALSYRFPVENGKYKVKLYFVEAEKESAGQRLFDVALEGAGVIKNYDIVADAKDRFTGVMKEFPGIEVSDGVLDIDLIPVTDQVSIAGITVQKDDGVPLPVAQKPRLPSAPLFFTPPIKKQLRDSSSVYNKFTGKWMHFGLLQSIDDSQCGSDSLAVAEMTNNGRGPWSWLGEPTGRCINDYAPVVVYDSTGGKYHMFAGSASRGIRHYTNTDESLMNWHLETEDCVPGNHTYLAWDPEVWKVGDTWYMATTRALYRSSDLYAWTECKSHLKAWWPDEHMQDKIHDYTDNGNDGIISGATWTTGQIPWIKWKSALSFDAAAGNYASIPNCGINLGSGFTLAASIKAPSASAYRTILAKGPKGSGHYELSLTPDNKLRFHAPELGEFASTSTVADNAWHNVAVTYDGSHVIIYIDGVAEPARKATGAISDSTAELRLGTLVDGTFPYEGLMEGVKVYDGARSAAEIQAMHKDPRYVDHLDIPRSENTCVFQWKDAWWNIRDYHPTIYKSSNGISDWTLCKTQIRASNTGVPSKGRERLGDSGYVFGYNAIVQDGRCFLTYSVCPEDNPTYPGHMSKVAIQVVEVKYIDGNLYIDFNAPFDFDLKPSQRGY